MRTRCTHLTIKARVKVEREMIIEYTRFTIIVIRWVQDGGLELDPNNKEDLIFGDSFLLNTKARKWRKGPKQGCVLF